MSTKALGLVVRAAEQAASENGEMTSEVADVLAAAKTELEALRKAAKALAGMWAPIKDEDKTEWRRTLESIAKEAL